MPTISKHSIFNFNNALANFLVTDSVEGFVSTIYRLQDGLPAIGAGYTLITKDASGSRYSVRWEYITDFAKSGIELGDQQALEKALKFAQQQLNKHIKNYSFADFVNLNLTITIEQAKALAITQFSNALQRVSKWLNDTTVYTGFLETKEMLVLADLAYNNFIKFDGSGCPSLKKAILSGNRAEGWYEIRYNTGGSLQRRIAEAGIFGLYNNPDSVSEEEATMIYEMFTQHRDTMLIFEAKNITAIQGAQTILEANSGLGCTVNVLKVELTPAADILKQSYIKPEYGNTINYDPLNIQVAGDQKILLRGEDTATRTGSNDDLLIGDNDGGVFLYGYSGNDLLIGGKGEDYLDGGTGNDILVSGAGEDTLLGGTGNDTFIVGGTDTDYDSFYGGEGIDTIRGGAGDDTFRVHESPPKTRSRSSMASGEPTTRSPAPQAPTLSTSPGQSFAISAALPAARGRIPSSAAPGTIASLAMPGTTFSGAAAEAMMCSTAVRAMTSITSSPATIR